MKSSTLWFFAAAGAAVIFMAVAFKAGGPENPSSPTVEAGPPPVPVVPQQGTVTTPAAQAASPPVTGKLVPDEASVSVVVEAIHDVAITYDPAELPKLKPYLLHADEEVRKAAVNGMIVLGDASAAPLLRDAARQVASSKEAIEMMQAADYLELPSATGLIKRGPAKPGNSPNKAPRNR